MKYMGSKNRIAKEILPIMLKERGDRMWVEPFVGGGNMIDKVDGDRVGFDINSNAIRALMFIRDYVDLIPKNNKEFTELDYNNLKTSKQSYLKSYAGFAFSYGGKWMGGWSRTDANDIKQRDYVAEAYRNAIKQSPKLRGCVFVCKDFVDINLSRPSLIYCDIPYKGTTSYSDKFDHDKFWDWCREMGDRGHIIFVSEYNAPDDFECVWQKEIVSSLTKDTGSKSGIEKLFKLK